MRPPMFAPMLASSQRPPTGRGVVIEPKLDGCRAIVTVHDTGTTIRSRAQRDVTDCYPELMAPTELAGHSLVLDGEIVAQNESGLPDFQLLQRRMNRRRPSPQLVADVPLVYVAFDLLWLDGADLTGLPLSQRRARLERLPLPAGRWQRIERLEGPVSPELVDALRAVGLEGLVVKADVAYRPGVRSPHWVKVKARQRRRVVVGGFLTEPTRARTGSLAVGLHGTAGLHYVGQVGMSMPRADADRLAAILESLVVDESPFVDLESPALRYVAPVVVLDVEYAEVTRSGTLRQPTLVNVVVDAPPEDVVVDGAFAPTIAARGPLSFAAGQRL